MILKYTVDLETEGKTIKHILKQKMGLSERLIKKLKNERKILLNTVPAYVIAPVRQGDCIEVLVEIPEEANDIVPEAIELDILYEDDALIAINKQPGIVVHPTASHLSGTVANALMYHMRANGMEKKIRPVSRLDRDTSGIILFAKNPYIQEELIRQMKSKSFRKEYIGIVHGEVEISKGTINLPIERKPDSIMQRIVTLEGAPSVTHYEVLEQLKGAALLRFVLETGRTHQIRVHCQAIGHPLLGDTLYPFVDDELYINKVRKIIVSSESLCPVPHLLHPASFPEMLISRQALHSCKVSFTHPVSGQMLELAAPIPRDMERVLEILKK